MSSDNSTMQGSTDNQAFSSIMTRGLIINRKNHCKQPECLNITGIMTRAGVIWIMQIFIKIVMESIIIMTGIDPGACFQKVMILTGLEKMITIGVVSGLHGLPLFEVKTLIAVNALDLLITKRNMVSYKKNIFKDMIEVLIRKQRSLFFTLNPLSLITLALGNIAYQWLIESSWQACIKDSCKNGDHKVASIGTKTMEID